MFPDGSITLQLIGVQLVLNSAGPGQSHACPGIKPRVVKRAPATNTIVLKKWQTLQPGSQRTLFPALLPYNDSNPSLAIAHSQDHDLEQLCHSLDPLHT